MNRSHRAAAALLTTLTLSAAGPVRAADAAPFVAAQAEFEHGLAGDEAANERAHQQFQQLVDQEPANPLYLAYLGSTFTLLGRAAWAPWTKMRLAEKGLALIDKALALLRPAHDTDTVRGVPVSEEVRLTAASTFLAVPGFMNRTEPARLVLGDALASPAFAATPAPVRAQLLTQQALLARRDGKAREEAEALRQAVAAWPDGATAAPAQQRLKELAP